MALFDEPKERPNLAHIVDSAKDAGNRSKVWLSVSDLLKTSLFSVVAESVVWMAGAGLFARLVLFVDSAVVIGVVGQTTALIGLLVAAVVLGHTFSRLNFSHQMYKITLFILGILLAVL